MAKKIKNEEPREELPEEQKPEEGSDTAMAPLANPQPLRTFRVERRVESGFPEAQKLPRIIGGICEFCGVIDNTKPSYLQYTLCEHYAGVGMRCTYCPPEADLEDVITHREFKIFEFPIGSGSLVVVCDDIRCVDKHIKRFQTGR